MADLFPTKQQFYDAEKDLRTVNAVSNSRDPDTAAEIDTWVTRRGDETDTLAGRLKRIGIERVGDFTAGCTVTTRNQGVLEVGGSVYVWLGAIPTGGKVVPPGSTPASTGGIGPAGWLDVGDASAYQRVLDTLAAPGGVNLVNGAVSESDLAAAISRTVEYYGATGDGVANDTAAVSAMIADVGYAAFKAKRYNLTGFAYSGQSLILIGERTPRYAGSGDFVDGTVLIGMNAHSVKDLHIERFGHKAVADGLVANSGIAPTSPGRLFSRSVVGAGTGEPGSSHAILLQGFNHVDSDGFFVADAQYGAVVKSQGGCVGPITGRNIRTAGLFAKGDTGVPSGGVTNGTASELQFGDVDVTNGATNATCVAAYIQSSTDLASKIQIGNVRSRYGKCGVEIAGGGTGALQTNTIQVGDVMSEKPLDAALIASGNPSDFYVGSVIAVNPLSGKAVDISTSCYNGRVESMQVVISDTAITSSDCGSFGGSQMSFGSLTVRNPYRTMQLTANRSNVRIGEIIGNAKLTGDGDIALQNLATAVAGRTPAIETKAGSVACLKGRVNMTAVTIASNPVIGTLPFNLNADVILNCPIQMAGGAYGSTRLYLSGTSMQILDANATNIDYLYLDGIAVPINQNAG